MHLSKFLPLLLLVGCMARQQYSPEDVSIPEQVRVGEPFVIKHCGFDFSEFVKVLMDGQYEVGGYMGWLEDCKSQTISLNTPGKRFIQFQVGGMIRCEKWHIEVLP